MNAQQMWNAKFGGTDYLYGIQPNDFLKMQAESFAPNSRILCLGDGEGRNGVYLASRGHDVTSLDASEVGLSKAQKLAQQAGVSLNTLHVDLSDYVFSANTWDAVVSIFCHLPLSLRQRVHGQMQHTLKPNGWFVLEGYHPEQLHHDTGGPKMLELLMDEQDLVQELSPLVVVHQTKVIRHIQEGTGHTGEGCVAQVVAQKSR